MTATTGFPHVAWAALAVALVLGAACPAPVAAQERMTLGWGRMFNNDALGDGEDRWRTGSYTISLLRGPAWKGALPTGFGQLLEFRARGESSRPKI